MQKSYWKINDDSRIEALRDMPLYDVWKGDTGPRVPPTADMPRRTVPAWYGHVSGVLRPPASPKGAFWVRLQDGRLLALRDMPVFGVKVGHLSPVTPAVFEHIMPAATLPAWYGHVSGLRTSKFASIKT